MTSRCAEEVKNARIPDILRFVLKGNTVVQKYASRSRDKHILART